MKRAIVLLLLLAGAPAHAERPRWMWTAGLLVRSVVSDHQAPADLGRLEAYGWTVTHAPMFGVRGDLSYQQAPIVDLGVAWAWGSGTYATLEPDHLTGSSLELGVFARVHWVPSTASIAAEPRVEVGLARAGVSLRGVDERRVDAFTRVGIDLRIGARRAGAVFSIDFTASPHPDDGALHLPTGGLTFSLSFYGRQWSAPSVPSSPSPR